MHPSVDLTKALIQRESITPEDGGCQDLIADRLQKAGFDITYLPFGDVKNIWARRGTEGPLLVFVGHTDVVPTGPLEKWEYPPFSATEYNGFLYGRGAQDMKSNIAAMIVACENYHNKKSAIGFLITSDEEGPSINDTQKVVEYLQKNNIFIDYCLVGEPSSEKQVGDTLKIGRRGTLSAKLIILGKQGHIAYPQLADNAIHKTLPVLTELITMPWSQGNKESAFFQKTSLQISNIHAGTGANNIIPGELNLLCNFRYSPDVTAEFLQTEFERILKKYNLDYKIYWQHSGKPFLTQQGKLLDSCIDAIKNKTGLSPNLTTHGGTSDGRFIAPMGAEVIELGVCNNTIHQINEKVNTKEIIILTELYEAILKSLFN